jgi:hypothetical protein
MPLILREARKEKDIHCHNYNEIVPSLLLFACFLETGSHYIAQAASNCKPPTSAFRDFPRHEDDHLFSSANPPLLLRSTLTFPMSFFNI